MLIVAVCLCLYACGERTIVSELPGNGSRFYNYLDFSYKVTKVHKNPTNTYEIYGKVAPIVIVEIVAEPNEFFKVNITSHSFQMEIKNDIYEAKNPAYLTRQNDGTYSGKIILVLNPLITRNYYEGQDFSEEVDSYEISGIRGTYTVG